MHFMGANGGPDLHIGAVVQGPRRTVSVYKCTGITMQAVVTEYDVAIIRGRIQCGVLCMSE